MLKTYVFISDKFLFHLSLFHLYNDLACNVLYLNSVETESLTGPEAVSKAIKCTKALNPRPVPTVIHFKVSSQGITLTDSKRRYLHSEHFNFRRHVYPHIDQLDLKISNKFEGCPDEGFS